MVIPVHSVHLCNYRFSESVSGVDDVTKLNRACHNNTAIDAFPIHFQLFLTEIGRLLSINQLLSIVCSNTKEQKPNSLMSLDLLCEYHKAFVQWSTFQGQIKEDKLRLRCITFYVYSHTSPRGGSLKSAMLHLSADVLWFGCFLREE